MDDYPGEPINDDQRRKEWRAEQARRYNTNDEQDSGFAQDRSRKTSGYEHRPGVLGDSPSDNLRETAAARPRTVDYEDTSTGFSLSRHQEPRVNRTSYRSQAEGETDTGRSAYRTLSFRQNESGNADPQPRTLETEPHRGAYHSQTEGETNTGRSANRGLSSGNGRSGGTGSQPAQPIGASTPRTAATSSSNFRTCVIEINISLGAGGRVSQLSATSNTANASAAPTPVRTATTIDNVHVIDIDLRLPKNTAYIKTDGIERH